MMHLTFADKTLLVGEEVAGLVLEYAAALARSGSADVLKINAYGADGSNVVAALLLDEGAPIMAESTDSDLPEPENAEAIAYLHQKLGQVESPPTAVPMTAPVTSMDEFEKDWPATGDASPS